MRALAPSRVHTQNTRRTHSRVRIVSRPMTFANPVLLRTEAHANLRLALPLIAAQVAGVGMGAVDTVFAGRLGPRALAAVAMGFNLNVVFFVFFMGLAMACSPVVAQMAGARREAGDIAIFVRRARRFALVMGTAWLIGLNLVAAPVLSHLGLDDETVRLSVRFVRLLSFSGYGMSLWFTQRFCAEGLGQTRPIVLASLAGLAANALLDWLLLFPHPALNVRGLPLLGAPGCGVATSLSSLLMAGLLAWRFRRAAVLRRLMASTPPAVLPAEGVGDILRLGLPIGTIMLAEAGLFVTVALLMARFGDLTVAAYQVAINFAALAFMIPVGLSLATTVRVGHAVGAGAGEVARLRGGVGMVLGLFNAASNALIMLLLGRWIAGLYTDDPAIIAQAAHFLCLAAVFQFFDGLQVTANGALRGFKDTRWPALITLVAYWMVGLPVAWWLAFGAGLGADGLWWGLTAGLGVAAMGLTLRYSRRARSLSVA